MLGSGNNLSRAGVAFSSDIPALPQCLPLEPIRLGNQKNPRSGELRRVLGVPSRTSVEDISFGVSRPKPLHPIATEELKHIKESVQDASREAGDRAKKLGESIFKLEKYTEALNSKKRRRNDISPGERMDLVRSQIPRTPDGMAQRSDERKKMFGLNKRARTSVADLQGDGRISVLLKQQVTEKDSDSLPVISGETSRIEEKIRRLPGGGEGWETKLKRKRSVAALGSRVMNGDQRVSQPKLTAETKFRSCDNQNFRTKSSVGLSGLNALDASSFEPGSPGVDTVPLARDRSALSEQRLMAKGNNKRNLQDDNLANSSSSMLKGKVSRAPRTGTIVAVDPSSKVEPPSVGLQGLWHSEGINKVSLSAMVVGNNQKLQMSTGPSAHAMAQWVGQQRPHKNSRTRRTNVVSPVIKHAESKISPQGFATSDFSPRASLGRNGSLAIVVDNSALKVKREVKNASSPYGLSESEESGAGESKMRDHGLESNEVAMSHKTGPPLLPARKNKLPTNHKGDGAWKQRKYESSSSIIAPGAHPITVKIENHPLEKPLQNTKIASDKSKSKSGRPPTKKLKDRKASTRLGSNSNAASSDLTGESDDDHEDLFAAANSARKATNLACSGKFWKKMEYIFASVSSADMQYMKEQLRFVEELDECLSETIANGYNTMGVAVPKEVLRRPGRDTVDFPNQDSSKADLSFQRLDMKKLNESAPLYKRVLSALIEEDDGEEVQFGEGKNLSLHYASDDSHCGSCTHIDTETRERDRMESEVESNADLQTPKSYLFDRFSSDKSVVSNGFRNASVSVSVHSNEHWLGDDDLSHSDVVAGSEICSNNLGQLQPKEIPGFPSSDTQYQLMSLDERLLLELQSIGVFPEALPDLEEQAISSDVLELKESVYQQIQNKKKNLEKLDMIVQKAKDAEKREIEHLAMDQLVVMAHKKRVACRGSKASKVRRVSRQVAPAFIRRTVARCRKFEETGRSCFADPALQDILYSLPGNDAKSSENGGSGTASNTFNEASNHQAEARGSGAVSSTKRIDDVVGSASSKVTATASLDSTILAGGVRGKSSERDKDSLRNKPKTKPKQKNNHNQHPTTMHPTGPPRRGSHQLEADEEEPPIDMSELPLELDGIGEPADLGNWFNFDDDGLQDIDMVGLEIPMDDLADVNLLM